MMGLERLFTSLYGSKPQLDMDAQWAKVRIVKPVNLDFHAVYDGMKRANVGTAGIAVEADVQVKDGKLVFVVTGQEFPFEGAAPAEAGPVRRWVEVVEGTWEEAGKARLRLK